MLVWLGYDAATKGALLFPVTSPMRHTGMDASHFSQTRAKPADTGMDDLFSGTPAAAPAPIVEPEEPSIDERFAKFHAKHPDVYVEIERRALALVAGGATRVGVGAIFEAMRGVRTGEEKYQLNNIYRSRYARLLLERNPTTLAGIIETRGLTSK